MCSKMHQCTKKRQTRTNATKNALHQHRPTSVYVGRNRPTSANTGYHRPTLADFGRHQPMSADIGQHHVSWFRPVSADVGRCRQMSAYIFKLIDVLLSLPSLPSLPIISLLSPSRALPRALFPPPLLPPRRGGEWGGERAHMYADIGRCRPISAYACLTPSLPLSSIRPPR